VSAPILERFSSIQNPVAFHLNGIGDRLMALPALRALAAMYPGKLTLIGAHGDSSLFFYEELPLRAILELGFTQQGGERTVSAESLRKAIGECDLLVNFNSWQSSDVGAVLKGLVVAETIGFGRAYKHRQPLSEHRHKCDQLFELVQVLNSALRFEDFAQAPRIPKDVDEATSAFRASLPEGARVLTVHTETAAFKQWPVERFQQLLGTFLQRHPDWIVVLVDYKVQEALKSVSERVLDLSGAPLALALSMVGASNAFLGIDSCMLHAADFFRVPSVGLFGPTPAQHWGFRLTHSHRVVTGPGNMAGLEGATVLEALESILG
jgi:ADP-heptose:LPS heptosyltransferase